MPELFVSAISAGPALSWAHVLVRLAAALVLGRVVASVYNQTRLPTERTPSFPATLVLLSVLIAMVTQVIGDNVARAFSLVGALSIVRFRTVVRDTQDTAFVIFAVVIGMAIGAGYAILAAIGMPAVLAAALVMRHISARPLEENGYAALTVRIGLGQDPDVLLGNVLAHHLTEINLVGTGTAKQGSALELTYQVRLRDSGKAFNLVAELNKIEGVQGVELRRP